MSESASCATTSADRKRAEARPAPPLASLSEGMTAPLKAWDPTLFDSGIEILERRSRLPVLGLIPWLHNLHIPEEDGHPLEADRQRWNDDGPDSNGVLEIVVVRFPRIANFDDFDSLLSEAASGCVLLIRVHNLVTLRRLFFQAPRARSQTCTGCENVGSRNGFVSLAARARSSGSVADIKCLAIRLSTPTAWNRLRQKCGDWGFFTSKRLSQR